jgi:hypothetical protein
LLLRRYPDWPVLHYGETEAISLLRLAERQGLGEPERAQLRARLVDVHQRLRPARFAHAVRRCTVELHCEDLGKAVGRRDRKPGLFLSPSFLRDPTIIHSSFLLRVPLEPGVDESRNAS